jgi:hypothetical protein
MPFLEGPFAFTGKLDMLSAYRMRGVDGIVVRRKGGPSREKIKTGASFANTRRTMSEFGGCSRHGSYVRMAMLQIRHLSDYNFGSDINSVMRQVQLRDGTSEWGRRRITLSEHTRLLEGFSTVRKAPSFDSIVRAPVYYTMDRANRSARIDIPELLRDINYFPQNNHAMFRLTVTLGIVPDVTFDIPSKEYLPPDWYDRGYNSIEMSTDWSPSLEGMKSTTLELAMDALPPDDRWTLMLSIGIEYGSFRENGKIKEVPRFGAAKIMALHGKDKTSDEGSDGDGTEKHETPIANEVIVEDVVQTPEVSPPGYREPEVRYVYIAKEVATKPWEANVYHYAIPVTSQNDTTQNAVSLSTTPVDLPAATYIPCDARLTSRHTSKARQITLPSADSVLGVAKWIVHMEAHTCTYSDQENHVALAKYTIDLFRPQRFYRVGARNFDHLVPDGADGHTARAGQRPKKRCCSDGHLEFIVL